MRFGKKALEAQMAAYFAQREGELYSAADLCAFLGVSIEELRALYDDERVGEVVRRAMTRIAAQLERDPRWMGSNASKSVFLLRQKIYGGYNDKPGSDGKMVVELRLQGMENGE